MADGIRNIVICPECKSELVTQGQFKFRHCGKTFYIKENLLVDDAQPIKKEQEIKYDTQLNKDEVKPMEDKPTQPEPTQPEQPKQPEPNKLSDVIQQEPQEPKQVIADCGKCGQNLYGNEKVCPNCKEDLVW